MSDRKHDGNKNRIWGGAEGQVQKREKAEIEASKQERLQTGTVIGGDSNRA